MEKPTLPVGPFFTDILVRTAPGEQTKFKLLDVIALEANDKYVNLYLIGHERPFLVSGPLQALEDQLFPVFFQRTHKSWIIGVQHFLRIEEDSVILSQRLQVPLSASHRKELLERFIVFN